MILGIDAYNIRAGGGLRHLSEFLGAADPQSSGFSEVVLWVRTSVAPCLPTRPFLRIEVLPDSRSPFGTVKWQLASYSAATARLCDVMFVPGGTYIGRFRPFVTMSQNLLPFEARELRRTRGMRQARLRVLRYTQGRTFRRADGLIFLTAFAQRVVERAIGRTHARTAVIPLGLRSQFLAIPQRHRSIAYYSQQTPFRLLYVSIVDDYKHQWNVVDAVASLRSRGLPLALDLVGPGAAPALRKLNDALAKAGEHAEFIRYLGPVGLGQMAEVYRRADAFLFASSCENMPNILLEAMAAGLPIAASHYGSIVETLAGCGEFFDPENAADIRDAISRLVMDPCRRQSLADAVHQRSRLFTWELSASRTLDFLASFGRPRNPR